MAQRESGIHLEPDIPYQELGFYGTPHKEMVFVQPTTYALVNVTHTPAFVVRRSCVVIAFSIYHVRPCRRAASFVAYIDKNAVKNDDAKIESHLPGVVGATYCFEMP